MQAISRFLVRHVKKSQKTSKHSETENRWFTLPYVLLESIFPLLNRALSQETCFGSLHSLDMVQSSLYSLKQAILTPKS